MSDDQLEAERLQRVEAVDAARLEADRKAAEKREADKLRKRQERANAKLLKDLKSRKQEGQLEKEAASKRAQQIESERRALLLQELPLFLTEPDSELSDEDGPTIPSWKAYVREQLELFLYPFEQREFSSLYWSLATTELGRLVLDLFGVEYFRLPEGWIWVHMAGELEAARLPRYSPRYSVWEFSTPEDLIAKDQEYDRLYPPGQYPWQVQQTQPRFNQNDGNSMSHSMLEQIKDKYAADEAQKKKVYHDRMTRLRSKYLEARKLLNQNFNNVNLEIPAPQPSPALQPESLPEPRLPAGHEWHLSKTSDWPRTE